MLVAVVAGLPAEPSGAASACSVASRKTGKHTRVLVSPDAVCYLNSAGAIQHANRFQSLFGKRCRINATFEERQSYR